MRNSRTAALALTAVLFGAGMARSQEASLTRPEPESGPTEVTLGVLVTDLTSVDDVAETMTLDFAILAGWDDPRLAWAPVEGVETHTYDLDEIWHPRLTVLNGRDLDTSLPAIAEVEPSGRVVVLQRLNGDLAQSMKLRSFPLDRQEFLLEIVAVRNRPDTIAFVIDDRTSLLSSAQIPGWKLAMGTPRLEPLTLEGRSESGIPRVTLVIEGQREVGYYLWTMFVPLSFIVFMAWTVFWIHPSFLPPMVGVATASAFSLIAYRTALRLSLPKVAYMTKADVFILGATVLVFSALGVAIASNRMIKAENEAGAIRLQRLTRIAYMVLFAILIVVSLIW
jgi:hypothetical protein